MKTYTINCEERVSRSYRVKADSAEDARARLRRNEYAMVTVGETIAVEILDVKEEEAVR